MNSPEQPLPTLHEATLDLETLRQLFDDVAALGKNVGVMEKAAARGLVEGSTISLDSALESLTSGAARGVQLQYDHDGQRWCDTLIRSPEGYRLTRMVLPASPR